MTTKKPRKSLGDTLANNFVYGDKAPIPAAEPIVEQVEPIVKTVETVVDLAEPTLRERVEPIANAAAREPEVSSGIERNKTDGKPCVQVVATEETSTPVSPQPTTSLMSRLMQNIPEKEPTVRLTVDLPQSTHKKLSILCANTGMKKVEVVRMLLNDALKDIKT